MALLGVAGCSFMAALQDLDRPDCLAKSHFTELLADELGMEYHTLARGGASNFCISHQIKQLIKDRVDLMLIGFTSTDRDEIVLKPLDRDFNIFDFNYFGYPDLSALDTRFSNTPSILSDSINNIIQVEGKLFSEQTPFSQVYIEKILKADYSHELNAFSNNFKVLYDNNYKYHKDVDTIISVLTQLDESGIPYVFYFNGLTEWIENKQQYIPFESKAIPINYYDPNPTEKTYRYHTTAEDQKVIKSHWLPYIEKVFQKISP